MTEHVQRAWKLLQILLKMRNLWSKKENEGIDPCSVDPPPEDFLASVSTLCKDKIPSEMAPFPATQPEKDKPNLLSEDQMRALECLSGQALENFLKRGYGFMGASVQSPQSFLSDKEIMRRTVLRGKDKVTFKDLSLRQKQTGDDGKCKKASVSTEVWQQVMKAGFNNYPVAKLVQEQGSGGLFVQFCAIPEEPGPRIAFHNMLMDLCQVPLRRFAECLSEGGKKPTSRKRQKVEAAPPEEAESADE